MKHILLCIITLLIIPVATDCGTNSYPNFSTPENTLTTYIHAFNKREKSIILRCFDKAGDFYFGDPIQITHYRITRKLKLKYQDVTNWNHQIPAKDAKIGDIQFDVKEVFSDMQTNMYSYWLRNINKEWKIYDHCGWGMEE